MGSYIFRRLLGLIAVIFIVSIVTFSLAHMVPGGPFDREKKLPDATKAALERLYGLDQPLPIQYMKYMQSLLIPRIISGAPSDDLQDDFLINVPLGGFTLQWMNFGPSFKNQSRTVNDIFRDTLPISFELGIYSLIVAITIGLPLGIVAALKQNTFWDYLGMGVAIIGVSVPVIVAGPLLIWIFAVELSWFEPTGWNSWSNKVLPTLALGTGSSAIIARLTRASLLQVIREDYIRTARAKGLQERIIIIRHALKNALIPVLTILGPLFAAIVTGSFVTEIIFGIPGMGQYFVTSITNRDYPVILGTTLLYAVILVLANLVVDLLYAWVDPRIRYT